MSAELEPSERVLWTGSPERIPLFEPIDRLAIPLQLFVVAAAVVYALLSAGGPTAILLWLFAVLGVLVLPIRMLVRRLNARGSRYTLTDRRIIVQNRKGQELTSSLGGLGPPVAYQHRDGTGTIEFKSNRQGSARTREERAKTGPRFTLWGILDAQRVRDLIATAQATD